MRFKYLLPLAALVVAVGAWAAVSAQAPGPTAGTLLATAPPSTGSAAGPDGAVYIADYGTGGDTVIAIPEEAGGGEGMFGLTGGVVRVDPETGAMTDAARGLGSLIVGGEPFAGPTDVAFMGDDIFVLTTGSLDVLGQDEWPNGIYRAEGETITLVADISEFNADNPVEFPDAAPGGNPFALDVRGSEFIVTDGNYNRVLQVTLDGDISILSQFENVVPTGIEPGSSGPILVTEFSAFPHTTDNSRVISVAVPSGAVAEVASGFAQMIDVEDGPGGTYVLSMGDPSEDPEGPPAAPFTGKILKLEGGVLTTLVSGFMLPTSLVFSGDTAYVSGLTGEVWQIENFSTVQPPAPPASPTAAPPVATPTTGTGVTAPDTGSGPSDGGNGLGLLIVLAMGAAGLAAASAAFALNRR